MDGGDEEPKDEGEEGGEKDEGGEKESKTDCDHVSPSLFSRILLIDGEM
jgi:hypothetical protein